MMNASEKKAIEQQLADALKKKLYYDRRADEAKKEVASLLRQLLPRI